jgi:hypothetical protein
MEFEIKVEAVIRKKGGNLEQDDGIRELARLIMLELMSFKSLLRFPQNISTRTEIGATRLIPV